MTSKSYNNLKEVREGLGYRSLETVARLARISTDRMCAIEGGAPPSVYEVEELGRVYGIEPDILSDVPITLSPGDGVEVLTLRQEFRDVSDIVRTRIVAAANAARDLTSLRKILGRGDIRNEFNRQRLVLKPPLKSDPPYLRGSKLAAEFRSKLRMGTDPVPSVRDLVLKQFPALTILYCDLSDEGPAGLSFVDAIRGPTIVLNLVGKNQNPVVRRFSLAHELCHMLVDWKGEPLAIISGYLSDNGLEIEQRANSFAVRLLCPPSRFDRIAPKLPDRTALEEIGKFGLSYAAARLYTRYTSGKDLPPTPPPEWPISNDSRWWDVERPLGIDDFPLEQVPAERRTAVAEAAARAYSEGRIGRDRFADLLGTTPGANVEVVLDFFGLDPPDRQAA
ncbi:MAG TPA: XRE family transcriptional regulator [Polyangia bacterium]|nr:XRE family transcriptional regulator [Polyangia bacterium]